MDISLLNYTKQLYLARLPHAETTLDLATECLNEGMRSAALLYRNLEINKATNMIEPDAGQPPQEKIIAQYSGIMTQLFKRR